MANSGAISGWGAGGGSGAGSSGGSGGGRDEPFGRHDYDDGMTAPDPAFLAFDPPAASAAPADIAPRRELAPRFEETGELALGDEDIRLPWLEGDDEDFEETGHSTAQVVGLLLFGLAAVALIGAGIWYALRDRPDAQLVADGATIQAPSTPYKTRPDNPGGEVVAGTGDTSFAVAEGQSRQVSIGDGTASPVASPTPQASASGGVPAEVSGVGVQIGAYSSRETAEKGWSALAQQYAAALTGVPHRIVEGSADIGTVYRLQAVPGDAAAATRLCTALKNAGLSCQVKR